MLRALQCIAHVSDIAPCYWEVASAPVKDTSVHILCAPSKDYPPPQVLHNEYVVDCPSSFAQPLVGSNPRTDAPQLSCLPLRSGGGGLQDAQHALSFLIYPRHACRHSLIYTIDNIAETLLRYCNLSCVGHVPTARGLTACRVARWFWFWLCALLLIVLLRVSEGGWGRIY